MAKKAAKKKAQAESAPCIASNWQAESDMRTLMEAERIRGDAARIRKAKVEAKKQMAAVSKVVKK